MAIDLVPFGGWAKNLRLTNGHAELIVTTEVGPRVVSYRAGGCENVFHNFAAQMGGAGETKWQARGGHRFWLAPEDLVRSYHPDNGPVAYREISPRAVEFINQPTAALPIRKVLRLTLAEKSARVTVSHRAENCGTKPETLATWGLSVMAPGGVEIIPLPPVGEHPRDLLPNRNLILWPYTDLSDPRWHWGRHFITLRQASAPPTKIGLTHRAGWVAYQRANSFFVKTIAFDPAAKYPDGGCNFETFTNGEMLEVEALGPLAELAPGESAEHTEAWDLLPHAGAPASWAEDDLARWLAPLLEAMQNT